GGMLGQDVQPQLVRPPVTIRRSARGVSEWALRFGRHGLVLSLGLSLLRGVNLRRRVGSDKPTPLVPRKGPGILGSTGQVRRRGHELLLRQQSEPIGSGWLGPAAGTSLTVA